MASKKPLLSDLKLTTAAPGAEYVPYAKGVHAIVRESQVDLLFMLAPEDYIGQPQLDRALIRVKVWSVKRPELNSFTDIRIKGKTKDEITRAVEFAAPALGERQEILYGDKHELSVLSREAKKHYLSLCDEMAKQQ